MSIDVKMSLNDLLHRDIVMAGIEKTLDKKERDLLKSYSRCIKRDKTLGEENDDSQTLRIYYDYVIDTKEKQYEALEKLLQHISEITEKVNIPTEHLVFLESEKKKNRITNGRA